MLNQILYRALGEPIGLLLATDDPVRARQKLYQARFLAKDVSLAVLRIKISTIEGGQLMIYHQSALDALAPAPEAPQTLLRKREPALFDVEDLDDLFGKESSR